MTAARISNTDEGTWGNEAVFFIGHERFLRELHEILQKQRMVAISAPAGMGKTTVAREYAHRFSQAYQWIFYLDMSSLATWLAGGLELMEHLALPVATDKQHMDGVNQALQVWLGEHENYLLIVDNVGDLALSPAVEQAHGHVLLLTRKPISDPTIAHLELEALEREQGGILLLHQARLLPTGTLLEHRDAEVHTAAETLADEMDGIPLALSLAGMYMRVTGMSVQDYLAVYRNLAAHLVQSRTTRDHASNAITIVCNLSAIYLRRTQPLAAELLWLCTLCEPDSIPLALFLQGTSKLPSNLQELASTPSLLDEALALCASLGLLVLHRSGGTLSMQPTVQETLYRAQTEKKHKSLLPCLLQSFSHLLPAQEQAALATRLRLAAHILRMATFSGDEVFLHGSTVETFAWAASMFWESGLIRDAEALLRKILASWDRVSSPTHPQLATVLFNLATLSCLLKNYTLAETFSQRAILISARTLGADNPDLLLYLDNLGRIYAEQNRPKEERLCYEKALALGKRAGCQQHPYYLETEYDLARLEVAEDRFAQAELLLQKVCSRKVLSPDTLGLSALEAWLKLADVSVKLEHWQQAEECYERVLPACEKLCGEEHPMTLHRLEQAGLVLLQREKFVEAERYLRRVLIAREHVLGSEHPEVAACLSNLAQIALAQEQFDHAAILLERAQSIYEARAEPADLALAKLLDLRAAIEAARERYEQAISLLQRGLAIREHVLGDTHLGLVENLSNLGVLHYMAGQPERAEPPLLRAVYLHQSAQQPEDYALDSAFTHLAAIAMDRANYWQAKMYLERSHAIRRFKLGDEDPATAEAQYKLALVAAAEKDWEEAERFLHRVLPVYQDNLGPEHPQTLECLEQLAAASVNLNKYEEAQATLEKVLQVKEQQSGGEHPDLVGSLLALALVCLSQKYFAEAERYLTRIIEIYQQSPDASPLSALSLFGNLATILESQGKQEQAAWLTQRVRTLLAQILRMAKVPGAASELPGDSEREDVSSEEA